MILFKDALKALRTNQGMSQRELAKLLNVSDATISKWETGKQLSFTQDILQKLCDIFDCELEALIDIDY